MVLLKILHQIEFNFLFTSQHSQYVASLNIEYVQNVHSKITMIPWNNRMQGLTSMDASLLSRAIYPWNYCTPKHLITSSIFSYLSPIFHARFELQLRISGISWLLRLCCINYFIYINTLIRTTQLNRRRRGLGPKEPIESLQRLPRFDVSWLPSSCN